MSYYYSAQLHLNSAQTCPVLLLITLPSVILRFLCAARGSSLTATTNSPCR